MVRGGDRVVVAGRGMFDRPAQEPGWAARRDPSSGTSGASVARRARAVWGVSRATPTYGDDRLRVEGRLRRRCNPAPCRARAQRSSPVRRPGSARPGVFRAFVLRSSVLDVTASVAGQAWLTSARIRVDDVAVDTLGAQFAGGGIAAFGAVVRGPSRPRVPGHRA